VTGNGTLAAYKTTSGNANVQAISDASTGLVTAQSNVNTGYGALQVYNAAASGRLYEIGVGGASAGYTATRANLYIQDASAGAGTFRMILNTSGAFSFNTIYTGPNSSSDINVSTYLSVGTASTQYWQVGKNSTIMRVNSKGNSGIGSSYLHYIYDNNATTANNEVAYVDAGLVSLDEGTYSIYTKTTSSWYQAQTMKRGTTGFGLTNPDVSSRIHVYGRPIYVDNNTAPALTINSCTYAISHSGSFLGTAWIGRKRD
jgi:hypothetical protein